MDAGFIYSRFYGSLSGLEDISPEELRAEAYKSKVANSPNTYVSKLDVSLLPR